jgi:hypothetical protein
MLKLTATLLVVLAVQLLGGMALAPVCSDPCPDDAAGKGCPPVCALCTGCTHAQPAIVQRSAASEPLIALQQFVSQQRVSVSSQLEDDIFHVPLHG